MSNNHAPFFVRLNKYFSDLANSLGNQAHLSKMFLNPSDKGVINERIYSTFLENHLPSKCNVSLGGFLFSDSGDESKQMDIIVTTDTTPKFTLDEDKIFSHVEGTLAVVSIKSRLDKKDLYACLEEFASIPKMGSLTNRIPPNLKISNYEQWPLKVIYAPDGIKAETILHHINSFYSENPSIPPTRRPDYIHVGGKYFLLKIRQGMQLANTKDEKVTDLSSNIGKYTEIKSNPDVHAFVWILNNIQENASISSYILYTYPDILNSVLKSKP